MADTAAPTQATAPRVVLDSNIWVDILIFDDAVARPIRAALEAGRLDAIISPACREELRRVLDYPQFAHYAVDAQAVAHAVVAREVARRLGGRDDVVSREALLGVRQRNIDDLGAGLRQELQRVGDGRS